MKRTSRHLTSPIIAVVACITSLLASSYASAQSGTLDPSFGSGGKVTTTCNPNSTRTALLQPDGKIVIGSTLNDNVIATTVFGVLRYNTNGSLDTGFGTNGIARVAVTAGGNTLSGITIDPAGNIVAAGNTSLGSTNIAVVRLTANGALDPSFGSGSGKVQTSIPGSSSSANVVVLQDDGKIVVGGGTGSKTQLVRYTPSGALDTSFGTGGIVNISGSIGLVNTLAIESDGNILAYSLAAGTNAVAQFTSSGALTTPTPTGTVLRYSSFGSEAVQADGKFFYGSSVKTVGNHFAAKATRYAENTVDTSFTVTPFDFSASDNRSQPQAVAITADGKVVVAGYANFSISSRQFGVGRLTSAGTLDTGFGTNGATTTQFAGTTDQATVALPMPDGRLVVVGQSDTNVALARYLGP